MVGERAIQVVRWSDAFARYVLRNRTCFSPPKNCAGAVCEYVSASIRSRMMRAECDISVRIIAAIMREKKEKENSTYNILVECILVEREHEVRTVREP